jgi:hypothetical protein
VSCARNSYDKSRKGVEDLLGCHGPYKRFRVGVPLVDVGDHAQISRDLDFTAGSAHASTMRDRTASACDDFGRRDQRISVSRSTSDNTNFLGRPVLGTQVP